MVLHLSKLVCRFVRSGANLATLRNAVSHAVVEADLALECVFLEIRVTGDALE